MAGTEGKRAGARRGARRRPAFSPALLGLALAITACVVAWGYLVFSAIEFGSAARGGDQQAWWMLGLASLGAVACLFVGLMLLSRVSRRLGITTPPSSRPQPAEPEVPPVPGGRRAAR